MAVDTWREHTEGPSARPASAPAVRAPPSSTCWPVRTAAPARRRSTRALRASGRSVGIASVYRVLEVLAELRLVQRVDVGDGIARFEPALPGRRPPPSRRLRRLRQGRAVLRPVARDARSRSASKRLGYSVDAHEVVLRGECGDCRELLEQRALELEQRSLASQPAAVAGELAVRADDAVAREHDRDRVAVHHRADRAGGPRPADLRGERAVRRRPGRTERVRARRSTLPVERRRAAQVERRARTRAPALEVLVELAPHGVERPRRAQHAHAERAREPLERRARARRRRRCGTRPRSVAATSSGADRRVDDVVARRRAGPRCGCGLAEAAVELRRTVMQSSLLRSRRTPDEAAWRGGLGREPSAAPISA